MNFKKSNTQKIAPFKGNKGKGKKLLEQELLAERDRYLITVQRMRGLQTEFERVKPLMLLEPNSVSIRLTKKTIVRNKQNIDFGLGIERIYPRWDVKQKSICNEFSYYSLPKPIVEYHEYYVIIRNQFRDTKVLYQFENERLCIIHEIKNHIENFMWLTELRELSHRNWLDKTSQLN